MAIIGIRRLRYGVENLAEAARFFEDFGLATLETTPDRALLATGNGAEVELLPLGHGDLPEGDIQGPGVREVIWGVDSTAALAALEKGLAGDHALERQGDGLRFATPFGVPMGLEVWQPRPLVAAPEPANAPGHVRRLNTHRRWRRHARPRLINHAVFRIPDFLAAADYMRQRLGFRLSDVQQGFGVYLRADGGYHHHNILFLNAAAPLPGCDGKTRFDHANFGVEDLDELMIGVNTMIRKGWEPSHIGLGRHRVDSALFYYLPCPAGGEAEYGADGDYVDDGWVPRHFHVPMFAYAHWTHEIPPFLMNEPHWAFDYLSEEEIRSGRPAPRDGARHAQAATHASAVLASPASLGAESAAIAAAGEG